jgi:hypothetical protein
LRPVSSFFYAFAAVAVMAAAAANAASAIRLRIQAGIVLSPSIYFVQVSQVTRGSKHPVIPCRETALLRAANYDQFR